MADIADIAETEIAHFLANGLDHIRANHEQPQGVNECLECGEWLDDHRAAISDFCVECKSRFEIQQRRLRV